MHGGPDWKSQLTPDEREYHCQMLIELEEAREELLNSKTKFDRLCDNLYLFTRTVKERSAPPH